MRSLIEWKPYLWISLGALVGANVRYVLTRIITRSTGATFPYGTLVRLQRFRKPAAFF